MSRKIEIRKKKHSAPQIKKGDSRITHERVLKAASAKEVYPGLGTAAAEAWASQKFPGQEALEWQFLPQVLGPSSSTGPKSLLEQISPFQETPNITGFERPRFGR